MADFAYGTSTFERRRGDFPALPVVNMLAESVPTEPGVALQSRPGLENSDIVWGSGPVRGVFTADGVLNNGLFGVSGGSLYSQTGGLIGAINGTGPVSFAGYEDYVFVNAGQSIWVYNGTTLTKVAFPDGADVIKIVVGASRLVAVRRDTGKIYWSDPLDIDIEALDFATAENQPDTLKDALYIGDRLILFGAETIEFWPASTDSALPFTPLPGATFPVGVKDTGLACLFNRTFAWVTNYNEICVGTPENIISEPELQVKIKEATERSLWTFYVDDNEYLAIRLTYNDGTGETWTFGARSQVWAEFRSVGHNNWLPQCYDNDYFGTSSGGTLAQWSEGYTDFGGTMERSFRAWAPLTADNLKLNNVIMRTNPGTTPYLAGLYNNPTVELRTSRDGGHEWQPWKQRQLGYQGEYRVKVRWASLGQFSYPGVLVEARVTDPVPFRMSGLVYNEPFSGR